MLDFKTFFNCIYAYFGNQRSKSDYLIIFFDKFMEEPISKKDQMDAENEEYNPFSRVSESLKRSIYNGNRPISQKNVTKILTHKDISRFAEYINEGASELSNDAQDSLENELSEYGIWDRDSNHLDIGKACAFILEKILENIRKGEIGVPAEVNSAEHRTFSIQGEKRGWARIYKKCLSYLEDYIPMLFSIADKQGIFSWYIQVVNYLNKERAGKFSEEVIRTGLIAVVLRTYFHYGEGDSDISLMGSTGLQSEMEKIFNKEDSSLPKELLEDISQARNLESLARISEHAYYQMPDDSEAKDMLAHTVFLIFFVDLYLVLTRYAGKYIDMIQYKTNADVSQTLGEFHKHVSFQTVPFKVDMSKRRIDICLMCNEANAHKTAVLIINEFERSLGGFENIFEHLDFYVYYIRAAINATGQDNVTNYNFETYTPTLMPLLTGGHLYNTKLVFIRELIQNSVDSTNVRGEIESGKRLGNVEIEMELMKQTDSLATLTIRDAGIGMGCIEIERYLTSIGRSFYTAGDFKKMNIAYRPISSFGIGFLSCFLVCQSIIIHTHKMNETESLELSIPNIEGCFFIEKSLKSFPVGTEIYMDMASGDEEIQVSLPEILEYADNHILDIGIDISFTWDEKRYTLMSLTDNDGRDLSSMGACLAEIANMEMHSSPCNYAFLRKGILIESEYAHTFQHNWWNKYLRGKLEGISLSPVKNEITNYTIHRYDIRKCGRYFFLFIPFSGDGEVSDRPFDTVESTYDEPYGIFIADAPFTGRKIRNKDNGKTPHSGRLMLLNAGIFVEEGRLRPLFGQDMRIYLPGTGTAYNNVVINFPPDWVKLNIARDKMMGLAIDRGKLVKNLAQVAVTKLNRLLHASDAIPLVNIQEIATLMSIICVDLHKDKAGKALQTELKRKKFVLWVSCSSEGLAFELKEDNGEDIDMREWFYKNTHILEKEQKGFSVSDRFFSEFESQMDKDDIESLEELDKILSSKFRIPNIELKDIPNNMSMFLFSIYLLYFPEKRIEKYGGKASHSRYSLEWQLVKKFTTSDFLNGRARIDISYNEIHGFMGDAREQTPDELYWNGSF